MRRRGSGRRGGLLGTAARTAVVAGTVRAVSGRGKAEQKQQAAGGGGGAGDDRLSQLERLTELKRSGSLTKQEFDREKKKLLG